MATARAKTETVVTSVTLELSPAEAEALRTLLFHVGGNVNGRRGLLSNIDRALGTAGVQTDDTERTNRMFQGRSSAGAHGGALMWNDDDLA